MEKTSILIIGAGPVGLSLALSLSIAKIPFTILEASPSLSPASKSIAYQPIIFPFFQKLGILDELKAAGGMMDTPSYRSTKTKEILLKLPTPPSGKGILVMKQSDVMKAFQEGLGRQGKKVLWGHEVVDIKEIGDVYEVKARTLAGDSKTFSSTYLVGADGGKSFVRKWADISYEGESFDSHFVATDLRYPFYDHGFGDSQFMIDSEDFGMVGKIGKEDLWRVSFCVGNEARMEDIEKILPQKFETLFPGPKPLRYEVINIAPYKCNQLCVERMRKRGVILVGDAAHLTNPYGGVGVTSGFFDVDSLSEALTSIIQRGADPKLLDAWSEARIDVFEKVIDPHSRANFLRVQDKEPETLIQRDRMFMAIKAGKIPPPLALGTDVTRLEGWLA